MLTSKSNRGEIVGFLGPNGAGKSTTMRILSGLLPAHSGTARVAGLAVSEHPHEVKKRIGYMLENNPLPEDMRVAEYLRFRAKLKQVPRRKVRRGRTGSHGNLRPGKNCQKENHRHTVQGLPSTRWHCRFPPRRPRGNPDGRTNHWHGSPPIQGIRQLIDSIRGRMTVILSSHILPEIERCCDRVIIINRGRIVACGTSAELRQEFLPKSRVDLVLRGDPADLTARHLEICKYSGRTHLQQKLRE